METNLWLKHVSRDRRPPHSAAGLPAPAGATSALPAPTPQGNTAAPGRRRRETGGARTGTRGPGPRRSPHPQCRTGSVTAPCGSPEEPGGASGPSCPSRAAASPAAAPPPSSASSCGCHSAYPRGPPREAAVQPRGRAGSCSLNPPTLNAPPNAFFPLRNPQSSVLVVRKMNRGNTPARRSLT